MKYLLMILFCIISLLSYAAVYQQTDNDGNVIYSDVPSENAKKINLNPPTTKPANNDTAPQPVAPVIESVKKPYTTFLITSPKDQETIQNQPIIPIEIKLDPALQKGDKVQLLLDGKPWKSPQDTLQLELKEIDRGTHQISAIVIDDQKKTLKQSNAITIFVHQGSVFNTLRTQGGQLKN